VAPPTVRESLSWRPPLQSGGGSTKLSRDKLAVTENTDHQRQSADTDITYTYITGRLQGGGHAFKQAFLANVRRPFVCRLSVVRNVRAPYSDD